MGAKYSKTKESRPESLHSDQSIETITQRITNTDAIYGNSEDSIEEYIDKTDKTENQNNTTVEIPFEVPDDPLTQTPRTEQSTDKEQYSDNTLDSKITIQIQQPNPDHQASPQKDGSIQEELINSFTTNETTENMPESTDDKLSENSAPKPVFKNDEPEDAPEERKEEASEIVHDDQKKSIQEEPVNSFTTEETTENMPETEITDDKLSEDLAPKPVFKNDESEDAPKERKEEASAIGHNDENQSDVNSTENRGTQTALLPLKDAECQTDEEELSQSCYQKKEPEEEASNGPMEEEIISQLKRVAKLATEAVDKLGRSGSTSTAEENHALSSKLEDVSKAISVYISSLSNTSEIRIDNRIIESENNNTDPEEHQPIVANQEENDATQGRNPQNQKSPSPPHASAGDAQGLTSRTDIPRLSSLGLLPESSESKDVIPSSPRAPQRASSGVHELLAEEGASKNDSRPPRHAMELDHSLPHHSSRSGDVQTASRDDLLPMREAEVGDPSTSGNQCQDLLPKKKKKSIWRSFKKQLKKPFKSGKK